MEKRETGWRLMFQPCELQCSRFLVILACASRETEIYYLGKRPARGGEVLSRGVWCESYARIGCHGGASHRGRNFGNPWWWRRSAHLDRAQFPGR